MDSWKPGRTKYVDFSSSGSQSTIRDDVYPYVWEDLQDSETCPFDTLLCVLLSRCRSGLTPIPTNSMDAPSTPSIPQPNRQTALDNSPNGSDGTEKTGTSESFTASAPSAQEPSKRSDLFEQCLKQVLPLCNDLYFQKLIQKFCDAPSPEMKSYAPFVVACNHALGQLLNLDIPQLRPSQRNIQFHVNQPTTIFGHDKSEHIPDVTIVSLAAASRVHGKNMTERGISADTLFQEKPPLAFKWPEVLAFVELERLGLIKSILSKEFDYSGHAVFPAKIVSNMSTFVDSVSHTSTNTGAQSSAPSDSSRSQHAHPQTPNSENQSVATNGPPLATGVGTQIETPGATHAKRWPHDQVDSERLSERRSAKQPRFDKESGIGVKQCGNYAAEMLSATASRTHVIGLFIVDQVVWIWWYDRQGAIQTTGIDLVLDLPRFVVMLLAFQRFDRVDWGYHPEIDLEHKPESEVENVAANSRAVRFKELNLSVDLADVVYKNVCLAGRGTRVVGASAAHSNASNIPFVLKMSWPNKARATERSIIERAIKGAPKAENHLPKVFASRDIHDTEVIRIQLGISKTSRKPSRVFRITVFERLSSLTHVSGWIRINAYVQCVKCHYLVWRGGVQHRDLSVSNLMVRKRGSDYFGVLNDWDLSFAEELAMKVNGRTATLPFLSLDLLVPAYWEGKVAVEYRHDLESFVWIMCWLAKCSESRNGGPPEELLRWWIGIDTCADLKWRFLRNFDPDTSPRLTIEWQVAIPLLTDLRFSHMQRDFHKSMMQKGRAVERQPVTDKQLLEEFLQNLPEGYQVPHDPIVD